MRHLFVLGLFALLVACQASAPEPTAEIAPTGVVAEPDTDAEDAYFADLALTASSECGNGSCEAPEDCNTCPSDCGQCCGNGSCEPPEDCNSCPSDCGSCCGNHKCEPPEDCNSCSGDCGPCQ